MLESVERLVDRLTGHGQPLGDLAGVEPPLSKQMNENMPCIGYLLPSAAGQDRRFSDACNRRYGTNCALENVRLTHTFDIKPQVRRTCESISPPKVCRT